MWQFILTAEVQRIGRLATTSIVPHAMAAEEGDLSEHAELQKISNLLITEWSQFVAREKKVCYTHAHLRKTYKMTSTAHILVSTDCPCMLGH